jgi:hypothetical protein
VGCVSTVQGAGSSRDERRSAALAAVTAAVADDALVGLPAELQRLCRAAVRLLGVRGAAIHVVAPNGVPAVAATADGWSSGIADASFDTGEGPSMDAYALARPVLATVLLEGDAGRWPGYLAAVRMSGVEACFALPLHVGAVRLGVLDLYAAHRGNLDPETLSMALTFADLATECLLERPREPAADRLDGRLLQMLERRSEIHQAQGMVMVDAAVDLATALALMRAHAFSRGVPLIDLAREILAGSRLPDDEDP